MTDKNVYRMSGIGNCPRALSAEKLGYTPEPSPPWLKGTAEEGKWHEPRLKDELREVGCVIKDEQLEVSLDYPSFTLLGHIDGKIKLSKKLFVDKLFSVYLNDIAMRDIDFSKFYHLEVKTMSYFQFQRWNKEGFKGFPKYADQDTCYRQATESKVGVYAVKDRSNGKRNIYILGKKPSDFKAIIDKVYTVEECIKNKELAQAEFDPNSLACKRCNYKSLCAPKLKGLTPVEEIELVAAAATWRQGKEQALEAESMIEKAKKVFEQHTRAKGIDKWRFSELAITLIRVKESTRYPKGSLLKIFTEEELKPASEIRLPYEYIGMKDLRSEE